tara:strand:+ start:17893 stop:19602 length:1710 start_codon:yes stop_codon:yes gene_type:complete
MKTNCIDNSLTSINEALVKILLTDISPNSSREHLKDVINILLDALARDKLEVSLSKEKPSVELTAEGWPEEHKKALLLSGLLTGNSAAIVLEGDKILWRRWHYEMKKIKDDLLSRNSPELTLQKQLKKQEWTHQPNLNKEQLSAIKAISNQGVILLSGGPGTGKTYTIIQMLIQALRMNENIIIGLAAPTGKATRRLKDTLLKNIKEIEQPFKDKLDKIPCSTLHSLLEARPGDFGKNKSSPLRLDLLVIDEMSMVDLSLMQALLEALPPQTQLVLVGDPNQLPPVGCGAIWEQLQTDTVLKGFGKAAVNLHKLYRNRGKIALLSKVIRENSIEAFWLKVLEIDSPSNVVSQLADPNSIPENVIKGLIEHKNSLKKLAKAFEIQKANNKKSQGDDEQELAEIFSEIFNCLDNFLVLCPRKQGLWGVNNLHKVLLGNTYEKGIMHWPKGTPVMCAQNQAEIGISNGDVGVIIGNQENRRVLFRRFSSKEQLPISLIHPARIKKITPAYALTIHKAQGSEAKRVILLWPNSIQKNSTTYIPIDSNEEFEKRLIYTAITRAKEKLDIIINMD